MEYGLVSLLIISLILILFVLMESPKFKKSPNIFNSLEYMNKKRDSGQMTTEINDNVRKATPKDKKQDENTDRKVMEAKKLDTFQESRIQEQTKTTQEIKVSEITSRQKTQPVPEIDPKLSARTKENVLDSTENKRDQTRKMLKSDYDTKIAPDQCQRIPGSAFGSMLSSSIPIEKNSSEKRKLSACKDTDRFETLSGQDVSLEDKIRQNQQEEWKRMMSTQEFIKEEPCSFEQAIQNVNSLMKEVEEIPVVLTVEEIYYQLLAEQKKSEPLPYDIDSGKTSAFPRQTPQRPLSYHSPETTKTEASYPRYHKDANRHSDTIEKWKKMLNWKDA